MKVLYVVNGLRKSAGTTTFVENVAEGLRKQGHHVDILTQSTPNPELIKLDAYDVIHIHGLWSPWLHAFAKKIRKLRRSPTRPLSLSSKLYPLSSPPTPALYPYAIPPILVWSTHGMTAPWSMRHKWWKKFLAWHLYQKQDLKSSAAIHCTTELEVEWNRELGLAKCVVAPLGTTLPNGGQPPSRRAGGLTVLFVGRIYPVKGLENLVRSAALLPQENIRFRIVGPDQAGHQAELMRIAESLGVSGMFEWVGPRYDDELGREYANCDLLVLPSFTENFGAVVIDALAHEKPVIASRLTPWKVLEDEHCGWWVDNSPESLVAALKDALTKADDLPAMGARGRKLVESRYTWSAVCDKMIRSYEELLNGRA